MDRVARYAILSQLDTGTIQMLSRGMMLTISAMRGEANLDQRTLNADLASLDRRWYERMNDEERGEYVDAISPHEIRRDER